MNKQFFNFTISNALFDLAYSVGKVFGILYFYILFNNSLIAAIGGWVAVLFCQSFFLWCVAKFLGRLGSRYSLIIAVFLFFLSFVCVALIDKSNPLPIYLVWILLFSLARAFYFVPYNFFIMHFTDNGKRGEQIGKLGAVCLLFSMLAPLIGGSLSNSWGLVGISLFSGAIFLLSIIPLLKLPNYRFTYTGKLFNILKLPATRKELKLMFSNDLQNKDSFWQIFVFIMVSGSFLNFGVLFTIVNIISLGMLWLLGKFLDHGNRKKILRYDGVITAGVWIFKALTTTPIMAGISDSIYQLISNSRDQVVGVIDYDLINRYDQEALIDEKLIARDISLTIFSGITNIIGLLLALYFGLRAVFVLAALGALSMLFF